MHVPFVFGLLLAIPTTQFSLDRKRRSRKGNQKKLEEPERCFHLIVKFYASDCCIWKVQIDHYRKETEENAYAKFWSDKQRVLWYVMVFSVVVNWRPANVNLSHVTKLSSNFSSTVYYISQKQLHVRFIHKNYFDSF